MGFIHRNLQARSGQQSRGCQPSYPRADNYHPTHHRLRGNQGTKELVVSTYSL